MGSSSFFPVFFSVRTFMLLLLWCGGALVGDAYARATLRFDPALATVLPVGKSGWVRLAANDGGPLLGAQFTSGRYASGASLRAISYATDYRISVPLKVPGC